MRATLTLIGDRVATGGDFLALGDGVTKTPGWRHLSIDFELIGDGGGTMVRAIEDMGDDAGAPLNISQQQAVSRFCHQYANFYAADLKGAQ